MLASCATILMIKMAPKCLAKMYFSTIVTVKNKTVWDDILKTKSMTYSNTKPRDKRENFKFTCI